MVHTAGIDFGTTNTTAAIAGTNMSPCIVPLAGKSVIPTTMFFEKNTDRFFWGEDAIEKYMDAEDGRFLRSLKRVLGTNLMDIGTVINGKNRSFQTIIGSFIKNVKSEIDAVAGYSVERVVMGRPVHFRDNDAQGDARAQIELEQIAKEAGFKDTLFQYEPIAAAFAHERHLHEEQLAAVIDIGGGTSDFTIIRLGGAHAQNTDRKDDILANTGIRIGGNDFDKQLSLNTFMPTFGMGTEYGTGNKILPVPISHYFDLSEWSRINSLYTYKELNLVKSVLKTAHSPESYHHMLEIISHQLGHMVLACVENTKIDLTNHDSIDVPLEFLSSKIIIHANKKEFEASIEQQTIKILKAINECVKFAAINPHDVQLIVLTGGSTEIPYIRDTLCGVFPNARVSGGDKLSSVGLGLAYDSMHRFS